jgi:hypothetical protein
MWSTVLQDIVINAIYYYLQVPVWAIVVQCIEQHLWAYNTPIIETNIPVDLYLDWCQGERIIKHRKFIFNEHMKYY